MTTLQSVIADLTGFWHEQGCAVLPPCSFEVPLGLLHPEAFFRLLDPEPWQAAFLQPISRPADARGGEHPLRVARHLQFQVVWKELDARLPRDLVIESLRRVGFELEQHDLRFADERLVVEAGEIRGRGWRVLLDGLRLGRISFLEVLAGKALARPSVEISYGVELLAMARGEAADIFAVPWRQGPEAAGEPSRATSEGAAPGRAKRREGEREMHTYAQNVASVVYLRQAIDGLDREATRCLEAGLPRIAYEQAMRMLPLLDLLETRGDLSLQERRHWLGEIRSRVLEAAEAYRVAIAPEATEEAEPEPSKEAETEDSAARETAVGEANGSAQKASQAKAEQSASATAVPKKSASKKAASKRSAGEAAKRTRRRRKDRDENTAPAGGGDA